MYPPCLLACQSFSLNLILFKGYWSRLLGPDCLHHGQIEEARKRKSFSRPWKGYVSRLLRILLRELNSREILFQSKKWPTTERCRQSLLTLGSPTRFDLLRQKGFTISKTGSSPCWESDNIFQVVTISFLRYHGASISMPKQELLRSDHHLNCTPKSEPDEELLAELCRLPPLPENQGQQSTATLTLFELESWS